MKQWKWLILLTMISCNNDHYLKEYYPNGQLKVRIQLNDAEIADGLYEEFYETGEIKMSSTYSNGQLRDTVIEFFKNGKIKSKGLLKADLKFGWWSSYDTRGHIRNKSEYLIVNDSNYKNQSINFTEGGDTVYSTSSYFKLKVPDTLFLGKNVGRIKYNSNFKKADLQFIHIIIDNQITEGIIQRDTFNEEPGETRFGIYAHKVGEKVVEGVILETVLEKRLLKGDSAELKTKHHKKLFKKKVFVINN
ncbi:MAG TPA: hypothetical protein VF581_05550 [Flavobacterium sp.]|jgi:antitoxin component YwqK of YwqJK toxin-antitoxin module